jgi:hypothetical protein
MDRETARARFLEMCEARHKDLRTVLELYQSAKVGHEEASRSTTVRSIQEVLSSLKDLEGFLEEK